MMSTVMMTIWRRKWNEENKYNEDDANSSDESDVNGDEDNDEDDEEENEYDEDNASSDESDLNSNEDNDWEVIYIFISVMYSAYIHVGYMKCVTVVYCDNSVCV